MDATIVTTNNKIWIAIASFLLINDRISSSSDSSDSSDSEKEDEDTLEMETLYAILMVDETRGEMVFTEKLTDYGERVIPGYSKTVFKEHFRMFPETFEMVLRVIGPGLRAINDVLTGRKRISEEKQLLIAMAYGLWLHLILTDL